MPKFAVVIPTFNEAKNIPILVSRLSGVLSRLDWEAIFVDDDSIDGTAAVIREIASSNSRIRLILRIGRHGLSSACVEGMLATCAPFLAVMDADLQHDEAVLPAMLAKLEKENLDIVIGTRHSEGGSMGEFSARRVWLSDLGKRLAGMVCHATVSDPMSGFFVLRAAYFREVTRSLSQSGFKILVDLLASAKRPIAIGEIPYTFRNRQFGESKLDSSVLASYVYLLADQLVGRLIPLRFFLFCAIGLVGVLFHLLVLRVGLSAGLTFFAAQGTATFVSMTLNYFFNNGLTFMDQKLKGLSLIRGLLVWYAACSVGVLINLKFAGMLFHDGVPWEISGALGLTVAAFWNYGVTNVMVWRSKRLRSEAHSLEQLNWTSSPTSARLSS